MRSSVTVTLEILGSALPAMAAAQEGPASDPPAGVEGRGLRGPGVGAA
jgi:hypothetical protein